MNIYQILTIILLGVLIIVFIAWLIAKWKVNRKIKKIEKEINDPLKIVEVKKQIQEDLLSKGEREVRDYERRRAIFRQYGDPRLSPILPGRGKPEIKSPAEFNSSPAADVQRSELQDSTSSDFGEYDKSSGKAGGDIDEAESEFDWTW